MVPSAPVTVFCRQSVARLSRPGCVIPGSPTGLEDLTPDVVGLWAASGDEYPTLDNRKVARVLALPQIMRPRFAGLDLKRRTSCDLEGVEIRTMGRGPFPSLRDGCDL